MRTNTKKAELIPLECCQETQSPGRAEVCKKIENQQERFKKADGEQSYRK